MAPGKQYLLFFPVALMFFVNDFIIPRTPSMNDGNIFFRSKHAKFVAEAI